MNTSLAIASAFLAAGSVLVVPKEAVQQAVVAPAAVVRPASALPNKFFYDLKTGQCVNPRGQIGLNKSLPAVARELRDGECMDLRGVSLNGDDLAYPHLKDWNLRGADLREARLFFAHLDNADLRGAKLDGFLFGYASIRGIADQFTTGLLGCRKDDPTKVSCIK